MTQKNPRSARISRRFVAAVGGATLVMRIGVVGAVTLVVDQTGGPGTYPTISAALQSATNGDEVHVNAGVYEGQVVLGRADLTDLAFSCEGPDLVTLSNTLGNTVVVERFTEATILGCTITGAGKGVSVKQGSRAIIRNNVIVSNTDGVGHIENGAVGLSVINNTIVSNRRHGILVQGDAIVASGGWSIINNVIATNAACGVDGDFGPYRGTNPDPSVSNNNVFGNATAYCTKAGAGPNSKAESPGFISAATGDYRLLTTSTSRNMGTQAASDNDPDGTRNDLGAYGGPGAAGFFPSPDYGPTVRSMNISPSSVPKGGTINLQATGQVHVP